MKHEKKSTEDAEALRFENEFLKAKIAAEYGSMDADVGSDVPPEVENEFLNNVIRFEKIMKDATEVNAYDFLERPEFVREEDLNDDQLTIELERLNDLLFEKSIVLNVIHDVEDRLVYKFITEEFFQLAITNKTVPGMIRHFIYEEFHPNHVHDTAKRCEEFLNMFFGKDFHVEIRQCSMEEIRNFVEISEFYDCFEQFKNVNFEILPADAAPENCIRKATLSFDAITSPGTKPIHYDGEATFELEYQYGWWVVIRAVFPGMTDN